MRAVRRSALALTALALAAPAALSPAGIASAAPAKPATPAAQLLLTQGEFPAGYEVQKVSPRSYRRSPTPSAPVSTVPA